MKNYTKITLSRAASDSYYKLLATVDKEIGQMLFSRQFHEDIPADEILAIRNSVYAKIDAAWRGLAKETISAVEEAETLRIDMGQPLRVVE